MYFSLANVRNDRAAQLAVMTASDLGERMLAGEQTNVAFESAIASISSKTKVDSATVAFQLLNQGAVYRQKAIRVGLQEIERTLGGPDNVKAFFRQVSAPRSTLRFESVGGVSDDINASKNRASALAMAAAIQRKNLGDTIGQLPAEREYIEFVKSVTRTLNAAVEKGAVDAATAMSIANTIEVAGYLDKRPETKTQIICLQAEASSEFYQEEQNRLINKYRAGPSAGNTPTLN